MGHVMTYDLWLMNYKKVIKKLSQLYKITGGLAMDREVIGNALNSGFKDFEDALQHFSAIKNG